MRASCVTASKLTARDTSGAAAARAQATKLYGAEPDAKSLGIPAGIVGDPNDFGEVVAFLCGQSAKFITGVQLQIDGGASLGSPLFPSVDHDKSVPFDGFHRAVTPQVLRSLESGKDDA